jgi:hypothetical protein|tara:strand:+ start:376 stop:918 length:543 start_codon:yes stop_codon:yes gene_type:complete
MGLAFRLHTAWFLLLEALEIGAGWGFQVTYASSQVKDAILQLNLAWLVIATTRLIAVRMAPGFFLGEVGQQDISSWRTMRRVLCDKSHHNHDDILRERNPVWMRLARRRLLMLSEAFLIHLPNIIIVGMAHLEYKITTASALTQVPSFYLFFYLCARAVCFPPADVPPPPNEGDEVLETA